MTTDYDTKRIPAIEVRVGDVVATWWGPQYVTRIEPYEGTLPGLVVVKFADGSGMSVFEGARWDIVVGVGDPPRAV